MPRASSHSWPEFMLKLDPSQLSGGHRGVPLIWGSQKNVKKETFTQTSLFELNESEVEPQINPIEEKIK